MAQTQNQTQPTQNWESLLKASKIEVQHVDFAINNINTAPSLPYEFVYKAFTDKIYYPTAIAVSGARGVIGAILSLKYASSSITFITTEEVLANQNSQLYLAKYALEKLSKIYQNAEIIVLKLNEFDKIKTLLRGGIYISGLPYEITIQIAQLAGFGKLWHFSNIQRKFYVF
jgi:hypothetical protein